MTLSGATFTSQPPILEYQVGNDEPMEAAVEVHSVVKRMLGNEFNARNGRRVLAWIEGKIELLPEGPRQAFVEVVLRQRDGQAVAEEMGIAGATLRAYVADAFRLLAVLARSLPKERFKRLFSSVYEHEFSDEVRTKELTLCLFGRYDRRSTQAIAVRWIPKVQRGEVNLPMPRKQGKFWIWTKDQAEAWRRWFAEGKSEKEEVYAE